MGDLDLDEALGPLLDPLGAEGIPRAIDPMRRWLALARLLGDELGDKAAKTASDAAAGVEQTRAEVEADAHNESVKEAKND